MTKRNGYPTGVPCWIDTTQPDPAEATEFYKGLFGWEVENVSPAGQPAYFIARLDGGDVAGIGGAGEDAPTTWNTYIATDSADDTAAKVKKAGGSVVLEPMDVGPAGRMAVFADPTGGFINVWQAGEHRGAQIVNQDGAWAWSDVFTTDVDKAAAFYKAVFGLETRPMGDAPPEYGRMLCRPGYQEHLAELDPEFPKRLVEYGAPEGFGDLVAFLAPLSEDRFPAGTPSHWNVTFSVPDTDEATAKAERLGAKVLVPPTTTPPTRFSIVADPAGAAFTLSKFTPPDAA